MCEWNEAKGGEKLFDGVILFKEYFDVLEVYLCGEFFGRTKKSECVEGLVNFSKKSWVDF